MKRDGWATVGFDILFCPQRGQRCCLREKAVPSTLRDPGQNEKENATWPVLVPEEKIVAEFFYGTFSRRNSFQRGRERGQDGAERHGGTFTRNPGRKGL